jgi:hypothetical protein
MRNKDVNINQMATAVLWWLSYTSAVRREYVLSEGAIKFPLSEYLETSNIENLILEYGHPQLSRKRIDLLYQEKQKDNSLQDFAFEFKYVKNGSTRTPDEKQRIFNDLMRLYYLNNEKRKGYFLICGSQNDFVNDFQRIKSKPKKVNGKIYFDTTKKGDEPKNIVAEGFYTRWFSFDIKDRDKEIDLNTQDEYKDIYDLFFTEYAEPYRTKVKEDIPRPNKIKTRLEFLSGEVEQQTNLFKPSKIGIWQVIID